MGKYWRIQHQRSLLANEALVDAASLRTTSIYRLAQRLSIVHPEELNAAIRK